MKHQKYLVDENTIWEDTRKVNVYNYPPSPKTEAYICKVYRQFKKDEFGWKEVEGDPIYVFDLPPEKQAFVAIMAEAERQLSTIVEKALENKKYEG